MGQKHNRYLVTAGILTIVYMVVPMFKFNVTGENITIFALVQNIPSTAFLVYLGAIGSILLAALIFAAVPLYRYLNAQISLVIAAMVVNVLLYAFGFSKYFLAISNERLKTLGPSMQIGAVLPIGIFLLLAGALLRMRKIDE